MARTMASKNEPAGVDRYLHPREVRVATVRRHPAVLLVLWGVLMLRLVWEAINWAVDYFVITSERILLTSGVFTRSVAMMPLSKVTDMSFHRSFAGRLLGYGDFVVESAGQDQALRRIDRIPYPEQLYLVVCGRIFKDAAVEEEEFDDEAGIGEHLDPLPADTLLIGGPDDSGEEL